MTSLSAITEKAKTKLLEFIQQIHASRKAEERQIKDHLQEQYQREGYSPGQTVNSPELARKTLARVFSKERRRLSAVLYWADYVYASASQGLCHKGDVDQSQLTFDVLIKECVREELHQALLDFAGPEGVRRIFDPATKRQVDALVAIDEEWDRGGDYLIAHGSAEVKRGKAAKKMPQLLHALGMPNAKNTKPENSSK